MNASGENLISQTRKSAAYRTGLHPILKSCPQKGHVPHQTRRLGCTSLADLSRGRSMLRVVLHSLALCLLFKIVRDGLNQLR